MVRKKASRSECAMIATLGNQAQILTRAADLLFEDGFNLTEISAIHTSDSDVLLAAAALEEEVRISYPESTFLGIPVLKNGQPVYDFVTNDDVLALMNSIYKVIGDAKKKKLNVHLCVSGGRKIMSLMAMVAAQLLFGAEDKAWYVVTEPETSVSMHITSGENSWLVPIPVILWSEAETVMNTVFELRDLSEFNIWGKKLAKNKHLRECGEFVNYRLTNAQREVVELMCKGLNNAEIAKTLCKKQQTVANQVQDIYNKYAEWRNLDDDKKNDRARVVADIAPYLNFWLETHEG